MKLAPVLLVAQWTLEQMVWSRRTLAMLPLAAAPVVLALVYRLALALDVSRASSGITVFTALVAAAGFQLAAPLLALVYASGVVSDDREAGTLTYFLTRPVPRPAFLMGKMLGSLTVTLALFLPAIVLTYYIVLAPSGMDEVGRRFPLLARELSVAVLAVAAYNGIFALAGTALRRPLLAGLFFVFVWQAAATVAPGSIRYLTIAHYLHSLLPREGLQSAVAGLLGGRASTGVAIGALLAIIFLAHGAAAWLFQRKEV